MKSHTYTFTYETHDGYTKEYSVAAYTLQEALARFRKYRGNYRIVNVRRMN